METEKEIRLLVYFIIVVLIFCVVYFLIYKKAFTENLQKNRQEFYALQKFLGEKEKTLEEFNKVAANYKLKEKSLGKINQLLLQKSENKLLVLIHFDLLAAQNGMAIENFSFEPIESSESGVGILPVNLTVKGTYLNFKEFLDDISESIPLMEVSKISFSSDSGSSKIYSFSLRIDIYTEGTGVSLLSRQTDVLRQRKQLIDAFNGLLDVDARIPVQVSTLGLSVNKLSQRALAAGLTQQEIDAIVTAMPAIEMSDLRILKP